jgi:hypothetical protein
MKSVEQSVECLAGEAEVFRETLPRRNVALATPFPPQVPHYMTRTRTGSAEVGGRFLIVRATAPLRSDLMISLVQ